jgi:hypothetical protein
MLKRLLTRLTVLVVGVTLVVACARQPEQPPATAAPSPIVVAATATPTAAPAATAAPTNTTVPTATPNPIADPITGAPALARGQVTQRPWVVMIDNHPDAYPQSGLDDAAVVFEALAEYGVTRFMAVYAPGITPETDKIGPVRSTRIYFAQWAMGFHGVYAHAGGSPTGLELVERTGELINLDALRADGLAYFVRDSDRFAPHNLFTSSANLEQATADFNATDFDDDQVGFIFKTDAAKSQRPENGAFSYYFIYKEDSAGWTYDRETNGYLRLRRNKPARDADSGDQLWTKNVVVMEVKEQKIAGDNAGRIEQEVIGTGKARLFVDGLEREVTWRKERAELPLRFYLANGNEIEFNAGPVWIAAIPSMEHLTVGE